MFTKIAIAILISIIALTAFFFGSAAADNSELELESAPLGCAVATQYAPAQSEIQAISIRLENADRF